MKDVKVIKPKKGEKNVIVYDLTLSSPDRNSKDISTLKSSILRAESITLPNRHLLYDLYHDVRSLDGHLSGIIKKRIDAVLNKNLNFVNKDKQQVDELEILIESNKFNKLIELILETKLWGCSGAEFIVGEKFDWIEVPRKHIRPESGIIAKSQYANTGIAIDNLPFVWVMGEKKDLGQLLQCSMYALYKRNGFGDYAQYVEIFGQPVRIIKYDANDTATKNELDKVLAESGSSLAMKIPRQADFEMLDGKSSNANGDLQTKFISVCNSEMSIAILGNTETTTSSSSSGYAQSKEHGKQQLEITKSDLRYVQNMLNSDSFIKILKSYGYPVDGGRFEYEMELDLSSLKLKLDIDDRVSTKVPVDDDYWYTTYGIPKPANYDQLKAEQKEKFEAKLRAMANVQNNEPDDKKETPEKKDIKLKDKKKLIDLVSNFFFGEEISLNDYYKVCDCAAPLENLADNVGWDNIYKSVAQALLADKLANGQIHPDMYFKTANQLIGAVDAGLGGTSFNYNDSRNILKSYLTRNVYQFSAAKSLTELYEYRNLMYDKKTKEILSYNKFLQKVKEKGKLFNETYLETEYTNAKQSAIMAHKWDTLDSEYLEYSTVGDGNVRYEHAQLNGKTYLKSDPIWNIMYPPIDWNCRCTVIPGVAKNFINDSTKSDYKATHKKIKNPLFLNNVGKTRIIYKKNHPYFDFQKDSSKLMNYNTLCLPELNGIKSKIQKIELKEITEDEYFEFWKNYKKYEKDDIVVKDYSGTSILFDSFDSKNTGSNKKRYKHFKHHILKKDENRVRYGNQFDQIVKNPNEVWDNNNETFYIKIYEKDALVVVVNNSLLKAKSMYALTNDRFDDVRKGILKYKSY
ncbi:MAG: DUF935 family protein [Bacteroidales bacterium]|nr:DUF935 family protein [Bacteroidales bacterium]